MTTLATKAQRDSLGINTIERGIVYALLLLRFSVKTASDESETPSPYRDAFRLTHTVRRVGETQRAFIEGEIRLPYSPFPALKNAWSVARNLATVSDLDPNPFESISIPYDDPLAPHAPIPADPDWVDSLEKYFGWLANLLAANTFPSLDYCRIQILEDAPAYSTFQVNLSIPFRYQHYLISGNLIESLIAVVSDLDSEPDLDPIDLSLSALVSARQLLFAGPSGARITLTPNFTANSIVASYPNGQSVELGAASNGAITGASIVGLLSALTGGDRLDAGAIKNLPSLNGAQIVGLLSALTGGDRLDAGAIKNIPSLSGAQIVGLLSALTGGDRLDASAIKNIPSGSSSLTASLNSARIFATNIPVTSIPSNTDTAISFNSVRWDTNNLFSLANPTRLTCNKSGRYILGANVIIFANSSGIRIVYIRLNGSLMVAHQGLPGSSLQDTRLNPTGVYQLVAGDYIELIVYQNSGTALNLLNESISRNEMWLQQIDNS